MAPKATSAPGSGDDRIIVLVIKTISQIISDWIKSMK